MTGKPPTAMSFEELGRRLRDARRDLLRTLALTDDELRTLEVHQAGSRAEDAATATVGDMLSRLEGQQKRELDEIEDALARLAGGTYGRCQDCGAAISQARLAAMPTARHCVECQRKLEADLHEGRADQAGG
jgi:RNA polymerase-binding transcription factor DksA